MHHPRNRHVTLLGIIGFGLVLGPSAVAQQPGETQPGGTAKVPDAIVLVAPEGDRGTVAVTYSRLVSHAAARDSLARLAHLAGWKLAAPVVKDQELFGYDQSGARKSLGKQTGIEATATGISTLTYGAAFRLQPFVEAYRDLDRLELFFMTGGLAHFSGLRSFSSPALSVTLVQDQGPYRYTVEIHDHAGQLPKLPLDEPASPPAQHVSGAVGVTESRQLPIGPIIVIAGCAGLAAFAALRLLTALHRRGPAVPRPGSGRPLHSGPYIVSRRKD